ncbi:helix-turn-helix domain-containing protein [uncultured Ruminococcus sp.]
MTLLTLEKLCSILDCTPNDIVEFIDIETKARI